MSVKDRNYVDPQAVDNQIFHSTRKREFREFVDDSGGAQGGEKLKRRKYTTRCVGDVTDAAINVASVKVKGIEFPYGPPVVTFEKKSLAFPYQCHTCDAVLYFDNVNDAFCPHCAALGEVTKVERKKGGGGVPKTQKYDMVDEIVVGLARRICAHGKTKKPLTVKMRKANGIEVDESGRRRAKHEIVNVFAEDVLEMKLFPENENESPREVDWGRTAKANHVIFTDTPKKEYDAIVLKHKCEYIDSEIEVKLQNLKLQEWEWSMIYEDFGIVDRSYLEKWMAAVIFKKYSGKNIDEDEQSKKYIKLEPEEEPVEPPEDKIKDEFSDISYQELRRLCRDKEMPTTGTAEELRSRLRNEGEDADR